jgi:hypothetical protein
MGAACLVGEGRESIVRRAQDRLGWMQQLMDLLVEPYLRCYRCGCWQDDIGVELAQETNLNVPR